MVTNGDFTRRATTAVKRRLRQRRAQVKALSASVRRQRAATRARTVAAGARLRKQLARRRVAVRPVGFAPRRRR